VYCLAPLYENTSIAIHARFRQRWLILFSLDPHASSMKSRRVRAVVRDIGILLLVVGAVLFARDFISSFHSESSTVGNGTVSIAQGFHTSLKAIGAGFTGIILVAVSVWLAQRD